MVFWVELSLVLIVVVVATMLVLKRYEQLRQFFREVRFEMGKVTWPTMDEVTNSTMLVFIVTIALAIQCLVVDYVFTIILQAFYR